MKIIKTSLLTLTLAFALGACGGGNTPPQNPDPEPEPSGGCCQLADRCVNSDDANACTARDGEFFESSSCTGVQCE
ncbi:MAG: hypothetical protein Tsb0020_15800 [Haliangiales bacterium]